MRRRHATAAGALAVALVLGLLSGTPAAASEDEQGFDPGVDPLTLDDRGGAPAREDLDRA